MMERKCDRCHAPIPDNIDPGNVRIVGLEFILNDYRGQTCGNVHYCEGDLCNGCAKAFLEWLHEDDRESGGSE